ncbi:MAG: sulfatase [Alphaproteobacteria bacterium]|nr:sulfatase [Alphaproteobacteria bacterium]
MKRSMAVLAGLLVLTSFATLAAVELSACGGGGPVAHPEGFKPNVLIVLWDTTRADHLSLYGYDRPTTPNLEAFAKEATVYDRATPTGMWTLVTHTSIFTGLTETESGAHASWLWLDDRHETLAERLGAAGYETFAFSANIIVGPWTNLTQGFENLYTSYSPFKMTPVQQSDRYVRASRQATKDKLIPNDTSVELSPGFTGSMKDNWGKSVFKDAAPVAAQAFDDFLMERADKKRPFFAYINMMEAHSPRIPSMESRKAVASPEEVELGLTTDSSLYALNEYTVGQREYTEDELKAISSIYDASVRDLDTATQKIFDSLKARGVLDDTVVIIVADHGEALGEHRRFEHRWSLYEELVHVPLIIRYPEKFGKGERVHARVSTADLYATINELAGLEVPSYAHSKSLVGRKEGEQYVYSQLLDPFAQQLASMAEAYPTLNLEPWQQSYCAVYEDDWKLTWASGSSPHTLVDLSKDPHEQNSLFDAEVAKRDQLKQALYDWEKGLTPYDPSLRDQTEQFRQCMLDKVAEKMGALKGQESTNEDDPTTRMLKDLGYAAPDSADVPWRDYCGPYGEEVEEAKAAALAKEFEGMKPEEVQAAMDARTAAEKEAKAEACQPFEAMLNRGSKAKAGKAKAGKAKAGKAKAGKAG